MPERLWLKAQPEGSELDLDAWLQGQADIKTGKISVSSPIARALIGKYSGDVAEVQAPGGVKEFEILDVKYA